MPTMHLANLPLTPQYRLYNKMTAKRASNNCAHYSFYHLLNRLIHSNGTICRV